MSSSGISPLFGRAGSAAGEDHALIIKLSTNYDHPLAGQAPGGKAVWKDAVFVINQEVEECDAWIVHEGLLRHDATRCPKHSICFLTGEPPEIRTYDPGWPSAFSKVVN